MGDSDHVSFALEILRRATRLRLPARVHADQGFISFTGLSKHAGRRDFLGVDEPALHPRVLIAIVHTNCEGAGLKAPRLRTEKQLSTMTLLRDFILRLFSSLRAPSIRTKITLLFSSAVGALSLFIAFYLPVVFEREGTNAVLAQARSIGAITAYSVRSALQVRDDRTFAEALSAALQDQTILLISVFDSTAKVVYEVASPRNRTGTYPEESLTEKHLREGNAYELEVPVRDQHGTNIGSLRLVASTKEVKDRIEVTQRNMIFISVGVFIIGLLIGRRISSVINAPLVAMAQTTQLIAEGGLNERVEVMSSDEVGALARAFNRMVEKLEESYHKLEETNLDLERRVATRTAALEREIAERIRIEEELRKLHVAVEQSSVSIAITDVNGVIEFVNPKYCAVSGYSREELIGSSSIVQQELMPESAYQQLWGTIRAGKEWHGELQSRHRDGTLFWESVTISPIRNNRGTISHFLAVKEDITERKKLEQQLLQAQKMESMGTLAGGIAHDFNNILGIIAGYASMLELKSDDPKGVERRARSISNTVERGASIVRQILTFARKTGGHAQLVDVHSIIRELGGLLESSFPKTTALSFELAEEIPAVLVDPTQLHQALLNLCVNARDAMSDSGVLTIRTRERELAELLPRFPKATAGSYVEISVSDTGKGMSNEIVPRIFEPFFTTKEIGKGTGLGLSVVYGIVQSHKGFIDVRSKPEEGSTFNILFPSQSRGPVDYAPKRPVTFREVAGTETVLVVEDENELRETLDLALRSHGYSTFQASDGVEGLKTYAQHSATIDVVVTDVGLPGLDGVSLVREIKRINPSLKVIACSGFLNSDLEHELTLAGASTFMSKPYVVQRLLETIRVLIDSGS